MSKKKRTKRYKPREVRTPAIIFGVAPKMREADLEDIDLWASVPLDAIARGEGTVENADMVMSALRSAYTLSAAFENKADMRALLYLATAGLAAATGEMLAHLPVTPDYLDPARDALEMLGEMNRQCDRVTLVKSMRATMDNRRKILKLHPGAGHVVDPKDDTWRFLLGKRGMAYLNGRVRTGYLRHNKEIDRLEWMDPTEEVVVPIVKNTLLVTAEPVNYEEKQND